VDLLLKTKSGARAGEIARGYAHAVGGAAGLSQLDRTLKDFGMGTSTLWNDAKTLDIGALQREVAPTTRAEKLRAEARTALGRYSGITILEAVGNASESGFRNAEALASMRANQGRVASGEWTMEDLYMRAATEGREVIDFANRPASALLRELSNYVPFFGAALQGSATFARAIVRDPKRAAAVTGGVAAASVLAWAIRHRSEQVNEQELDRLPGERAGFLFFPMDDEGKHVVRVPLSQEMGVIAAGVTAGLDAWKDKDPHAAALFWEAIARSLPPGVDALAKGDLMVPVPGIQQAQEIARNRAFYNDAPVESHEMQQMSPAERRRDGTPHTADLMAAAARGVGLRDVSPVQAEHFLKGITSRYTPVITAATDPIARALLGRERLPDRVPPKVSRSPLVPWSGLMANPAPSTTASMNDFYRLRERSTQADADLKAGLGRGDAPLTERALQRLTDDPAVLVMSGGIRDATDDTSRALRDAQEQVRRAYREGSMTKEQAQDRLEEITRARAMLFRRMMRGVRSARDSAQ
jgi:hypothetical protein